MSMSRILKSIGLVVMASLIGFLAIVAVFAIPKSWVEGNTERSFNLLYDETGYHDANTWYANSRYDNYTDAVMLGIALNVKETQPVEAAARDTLLWNDWLTENPINPSSYYFFLQRQRHINGDAYTDKEISQIGTYDYSRYFHGYLVVLRPMLIFFNLGDIRYIHMFVQILLVAYLIKLLFDAKRKGLIIPFLATYFFMHPFAVSQDLQNISVFYVMLISSVLLLKFRNYIAKKPENLPIIFVGIGCATSYFDFLTYPVAAFGIPAIIALSLFVPDSGNRFISTFKMGIGWSFGYVGMWMIKWLYSALILGFKNFDIAFSAGRRFGLEDLNYATGNTMNFFDVILVQLYAASTIVLLILFITFIIHSIQKIRQGQKITPTASLLVLLYILIPNLWYAIVVNHSRLHYWMEYRELAVAVFALFAIFELSRTEEKSQISKKSQKIDPAV